MNKPEHHILVCGSFRNGAVSGVCAKQGATLFQYLTEGAEERGLDAMVSVTGCLNLCVHGPAVIVYPDGKWYKQVTEDVADAILDSLAGDGEVPEENILAA
jgi:(2Fe-2S) ferredoxin